MILIERKGGRNLVCTVVIGFLEWNPHVELQRKDTLGHSNIRESSKQSNKDNQNIVDNSQINKHLGW